MSKPRLYNDYGAMTPEAAELAKDFEELVKGKVQMLLTAYDPIDVWKMLVSTLDGFMAEEVLINALKRKKKEREEK